jgi:hypothetical protein
MISYMFFTKYIGILSHVWLFLIASTVDAIVVSPLQLTYTGSVQTFTVPADVYSITVLLAGASGGAQTGSAFGGNGGTISSSIPVTPGVQLKIYVGERGIGQADTGSCASPVGGIHFFLCSIFI